MFAATPTVAAPCVATCGKVRQIAASCSFDRMAAAHFSPGRLNALDAEVDV